ncbi:hypothetical protein DSM104440_00278 [Usitatibacter palustris]|uniref:Uncharacterized protein n=1 Tax=Usitatibacter palustris TaxID=2732487 RepID=A0A6M4H4Q2_9PROT|nr:hypothetical protein DSM104440_00278 [Usitatibacter palustris]
MRPSQNASFGKNPPKRFDTPYAICPRTTKTMGTPTNAMVSSLLFRRWFSMPSND